MCHMYETEWYQEFQDLYKNFHDGHSKQLMKGPMMAKNQYDFSVIKLLLYVSLSKININVC